jgi:FlaG/FlaF family flagellin (archaellin)
VTDSGDNGEKQKSRDPKKTATILLILIAVIMLALLVNNCVTDRSEEPSSNSESAEPTGAAGNTDDSKYLIDYTGD